MRVLFVGGTRSAGAVAARQLANAGHLVGVFHRGEHEADLPASVVHFRSPAAAMPVVQIPDELRAFEPEVVVHMIAMGEDDTLAAVRAFAGVAERLVVASSGDVYRAYDVLRRRDDGPPNPSLLHEDSPLRTKLYPYRSKGTKPGSLNHLYDKILVEGAAASDLRLPATVLRFPKLYGPADNEDLATVYAFREHPGWRWTHGHSKNVGAAIALAATDERAAGRKYNVGEEYTPTMAERLASLPPRGSVPSTTEPLNFDQPIAYDTSRIRRELGYQEVLGEAEAMVTIASGRSPA
jgi:nucleoside-diphosphate-sugar epimerase